MIGGPELRVVRADLEDTLLPNPIPSAEVIHSLNVNSLRPGRATPSRRLQPPEITSRRTGSTVCHGGLQGHQEVYSTI